MTLHWYRPPRASSSDLETYLEHLRPLGVRWKNWNAPAVVYRMEDDDLLAEIGDITVGVKTGVIGIWPYRDIGTSESFVLAATAQKAFSEVPSTRGGWHFRRRPNGKHYWLTHILVAVKENGVVGRLVAQHRERIELEGRDKSVLDIAVESG